MKVLEMRKRQRVLNFRLCKIALIRAERLRNVPDGVTHTEHREMEEGSINVPHMRLLISNGSVAYVSPEDWPIVSKMRWCDKGGGYIHGRWKKEIGGSGEIVYLHRFIMRAPKGLVVDHIDGNPLNNTRSNLQITTYSRNSMRAYQDGGVTKMHKRDRWRARLRVDGKMFSLGCYATEDEARDAIAAAKELVWDDPTINQLGTIA